MTKAKETAPPARRAKAIRERIAARKSASAAPAERKKPEAGESPLAYVERRTREIASGRASKSTKAPRRKP